MVVSVLLLLGSWLLLRGALLERGGVCLGLVDDPCLGEVGADGYSLEADIM